MANATSTNNRPFWAKFPSSTCVQAFHDQMVRKGLDNGFFNIVVNTNRNTITMEHAPATPQVVFDSLVPLLRSNNVLEVDY